MRIGFLSDAHGNVEAFDAGRRVLDRLGAEIVYFLGDAVGYLPGAAVVDAITGAGIPALAGNHEVMLLAHLVGEGPASDRDAAYRLAETAAMMTDAQLEAIRAWPLQRRLPLSTGSALLVHGSPADPVWGYVYPDTDLTPFASSGAVADRVVLMGNTHRPFVRQFGPTTFVNAGSCGLPRDVGALGACCLYDDDTGVATIARFDIREPTAQALRRCGPVHQLVTNVMTREEDRYVGELVAN